jgi:hypothetical protein
MHFKQYFLLSESIEENFDSWLQSLVAYAKPSENELKTFEPTPQQKHNIIQVLKSKGKENQDFMKFLIGVLLDKPNAMEEDLAQAIENLNQVISFNIYSRRQIALELGWLNAGKAALEDFTNKIAERNALTGKRQEVIQKAKGTGIDLDPVYKDEKVAVYHIPPLEDVNEETLLRQHKLYCKYGAGTNWCTAKPSWNIYKDYVEHNVYIIHINNQPAYQYIDSRDPESNISNQFRDINDQSVKLLDNHTYDVLHLPQFKPTVENYPLIKLISKEEFHNLSPEEQKRYFSRLENVIYKDIGDRWEKAYELQKVFKTLHDPEKLDSHFYKMIPYKLMVQAFLANDVTTMNNIIKENFTDENGNYNKFVAENLMYMFSDLHPRDMRSVSLDLYKYLWHLCETIPNTLGYMKKNFDNQLSATDAIADAGNRIGSHMLQFIPENSLISNNIPIVKFYLDKIPNRRPLFGTAAAQRWSTMKTFCNPRAMKQVMEELGDEIYIRPIIIMALIDSMRTDSDKQPCIETANIIIKKLTKEELGRIFLESMENAQWQSGHAKNHTIHQTLLDKYITEEDIAKAYKSINALRNNRGFLPWAHDTEMAKKLFDIIYKSAPDKKEKMIQTFKAYKIAWSTYETNYLMNIGKSKNKLEEYQINDFKTAILMLEIYSKKLIEFIMELTDEEILNFKTYVDRLTNSGKEKLLEYLNKNLRWTQAAKNIVDGNYEDHLRKKPSKVIQKLLKLFYTKIHPVQTEINNLLGVK